MEHARDARSLTRGATLRHWLVADALTCAVFGALLVIAATPLSTLFGLPRGLLFWSGLVLFPCSALMALAAKSLAKPLVWLVIGGNAAWIAGSIAVTWMFELTGLGLAVVTLQAAAVALLAALEWRALEAHR
jgi:hypothetical protein